MSASGKPSAAVAEALDLVGDRLALNVRRAASRITRPVFGRASTDRCDGKCCRGGVAVSTAERDAILRHREAVTRAMEASPRPGVRPREGNWFTRREKRDPDFAAGRSVDTRVVAGGCVFLRSDRLCAVHAASAEVAGHPYALKPAYCILFPICVERETLDVCRGSWTRRPECCSPVRRGTRTPLAVFASTTAALRTAPSRKAAPKPER